MVDISRQRLTILVLASLALVAGVWLLIDGSREGSERAEQSKSTEVSSFWKRMAHAGLRESKTFESVGVTGRLRQQI